MNGGYCMVDMTGIDLSITSAQKLDGIYNKVYSCMDTNKPIMIYGLFVENDGIMTPAYCTAVISGEVITITLNGKTLTITKEDNVTVA